MIANAIGDLGCVNIFVLKSIFEILNHSLILVFQLNVEINYKLNYILPYLEDIKKAYTEIHLKIPFPLTTLLPISTERFFRLVMYN